jgi:hypothetical protein
VAPEAGWTLRTSVGETELVRASSAKPKLVLRVALYLRSSTLDLQPESFLVQEEVLRTNVANHGSFVLLPITDQTRGHGTHTIPAVWHSYLEQFLGSLGH